MKKVWVFCLASILALALAVPASAFQVKIGARIKAEIMYSWRSGEAYNAPNRRQDGGATWNPDLTSFSIGLQDESYLRVDFMTNDKSTGVRVELNVRADAMQAGVGAVGLRHMYGWYKFGRCKMVIGHTDNLFGGSGMAPYAQIGWTFQRRPADLNTRIRTNFINHGRIKSGRFAQVALYYTVGPWTFMGSIGQGGDVTEGVYTPVGVQSVFNSMYPRLDLVVMYKGKYIKVAPGLSVGMTNYETIDGATLQDDRIFMWALVLPFHVSLGRFGFKGELFAAKNYVAPNHDNQFAQAIYWGGNNDGNTRFKVEDTYMMGGCLGFYYKVGRATIWLSGGWQKNTNSSNDQVGTWRHGQVVKYGFSFAVPYRINKHLTIAPEIAYYSEGQSPYRDTGTNANIAANTTADVVYSDLGSLWLAGILVTFKF